MEASRPRLLFLCQTLPYPPDSGVHNRSYNILRQLARRFDVTSLCFYRKSTRPSEEAVREGVRGLEAYGAAAAYPIPQEHSLWRRVVDHGRSLMGATVYTRYVHESREYRHRLEDSLAAQSFDVVHVDSLDLSAYLPTLEGIPVACTHHNCEHELLRRRAAAEKNPLVRAYLGFQAERSREEAEFWCPRVALNVTVSNRDRDQLKALAPEAEFLVVENGVDTEYFSPDPTGPPAAEDPPTLVFVGGLMWFPNRDALEFFGSDILPLIRERVGEVRVLWVGHSDPETRTRMSRRFGVELTGYVKDIRPFVRDADCYVAPLRVGGGTRLKILDAWALGAPIVSTSIGCEGLESRPGCDILIADQARDFADAVIRVLREPNTRDSLARAGRETAKRRYDWNVVAEPLVHRYLDLASGSARVD